MTADSPMEKQQDNYIIITCPHEDTNNFMENQNTMLKFLANLFNKNLNIFIYYSAKSQGSYKAPFLKTNYPNDFYTNLSNTTVIHFFTVSNLNWQHSK